jgi:S1-C subfamily serine protease
MALIQSDPSKKEWAVFISNPRWDSWIAKKKQHTLRFAADDKSWSLYFSVNDQNALSTFGVFTDFINSIADADSLEILSENYVSLASLDMKDSRAAIRAVVDCVRDHPYVAERPRPEPTPIPPPEPEILLSGTAFFVASNRLITNNHVVRDCKGLIEIKYPDQPSRPAYIDAQDATNDLALLHTDMSSPSIASFQYGPRLGEQVASYGFPYSGLLSSSGNFTLGNVTALSGMNDDSRFLQTSTPIQPGNSGGPLLDMSGSIVGIVVSQLDAMLMMKVGESVPQNVNFAIQTPIVTNFLSVRGVTPKLRYPGDSLRSDMAPPAVAEIAKKFTVQIYCKGTPKSLSSTVDGRALSGWSAH